MSVFSEIQRALNDRLDWLTGDLPVAWEGTCYTPEPGQAFLKPHFLPATPFQATLGENGLNRHAGVFQVSVVYPLGEGWGEPLTTAETVVELFKRGTRLASPGGLDVVLTGAGIGPAIVEEEWYTLPVSVSFYCYAPN
jgi:hypothetical protein